MRKFLVTRNGSREEAINLLGFCACADSYAIDEFGRLLILNIENGTFIEVKDTSEFAVVFDVEGDD